MPEVTHLPKKEIQQKRAADSLLWVKNLQGKRKILDLVIWGSRKATPKVSIQPSILIATHGSQSKLSRIFLYNICLLLKDKVLLYMEA